MRYQVDDQNRERSDHDGVLENYRPLDRADIDHHFEPIYPPTNITRLVLAPHLDIGQTGTERGTKAPEKQKGLLGLSGNPLFYLVRPARLERATT